MFCDDEGVLMFLFIVVFLMINVLFVFFCFYMMLFKLIDFFVFLFVIILFVLRVVLGLVEVYVDLIWV